MTEREIQLLGFTQEHTDSVVCTDGKISWNEEGAHYYTYEVTKGLTFITNTSDEAIDGQWFVEVFNTLHPIRFHKFEEVQSLLNKLEKAKINGDTKQ